MSVVSVLCHDIFKIPLQQLVAYLLRKLARSLVRNKLAISLSTGKLRGSLILFQLKPLTIVWCTYPVDGGSKYSDLHDQQGTGQVGSSVVGGESVSSQAGPRSAATADLIDLMSSGSPEYHGHLQASGHLQMRPRPTPPKKTQSC